MRVSPSAIANSDMVGLMSSVLDGDVFLTGLLNEVAVSEADWLQELRLGAANWVRRSSIPTTRDEEWRFTNLSELRRVEFHKAQGLGDGGALNVTSLGDYRLVFVNGVYAPELSTVADLPSGIVVGNLCGLSLEGVGKYLAQSEGAGEVFTALNTAGLTDAAVVWVEKNVVVDAPIYLLFISVAGEVATISQPRCLVVAESGSQVSLVEEYRNHRGAESVEVESYFTNAVTEVWVGENAQVSHVRLQGEGLGAFHVGKTAVTQSRSSRYICYGVTLGARLSRHNLEILQAGEQTETTLNGLTMVGGEQVADTHSAIALNYPHGISRQLHKCIVGDRAHAIFNGKIFVPKLAQLTNATQLNRNLLLSSKARVDTKPQLEITADNVKCAHGATVSQLEDDEIFYLQSRGIDENDARQLLINAFASEIINQIPISSLRDILLNTVTSLK